MPQCAALPGVDALSTALTDAPDCRPFEPIMKTADESWRLFIALELPSALRSRVKGHIDHLRQAVPDARASWAREENLHLTLKFLGDTAVEKVDALSQAIQHTANQLSPFEVIIAGGGVFPSHGQPRVLWLGIEDLTNSLSTLSRSLEDECAKAGFLREPRAYHPHLTVARLRQPHGARRLAEVHREVGFDPVPVNVREVCLIRSELRSEGSLYTVIARHEFSGL
ncbi:MAG: 2,3-cyclic 3-phosphodiesterase [Blastocatellia bacterium]|nr:2,3-cyclic 3-phosphodiesterase [Blastocatellia bacterium]